VSIQTRLERCTLWSALTFQRCSSCGSLLHQCEPISLMLLRPFLHFSNTMTLLALVIHALTWSEVTGAQQCVQTTDNNEQQWPSVMQVAYPVGETRQTGRQAGMDGPMTCYSLRLESEAGRIEPSIPVFETSLTGRPLGSSASNSHICSAAIWTICMYCTSKCESEFLWHIVSFNSFTFLLQDRGKWLRHTHLFIPANTQLPVTCARRGTLLKCAKETFFTSFYVYP
jgi:hypothetical protein